MQDSIGFGWWLGVAVTGAVASVAIPVIKNKLQTRKGNSSAPSAAFTAEVEKISASESYRSLQVARVAHHYGQASFLGLATLILFFFGAAIEESAGFISIILFAAGVATTVLATREMRYGQTSYEQIKAACENN